MHFVERGGARVGYEDVGTSDTVLLCLPDFCDSHETMAPLTAALAGRHRVITVDYRGHGASPPPRREFGLYDLVDDVVGVVEAAGASRVVPIAQGQAGWIAIELRRRLEDRVPRIVSLDWSLEAPSPHFVATLESLEGVRSWEKARDRLIDRWTKGAPPEVASTIRRSLLAQGQAMWARAAREIWSAYDREGSPTRALSWLSPRIPVLHLVSASADHSREDHAHRLSIDYPWLDTVGVDATSHYPALEAPRAVAAIVERFLDWHPDIAFEARDTWPGGFRAPRGPYEL